MLHLLRIIKTLFAAGNGWGRILLDRDYRVVLERPYVRPCVVVKRDRKRVRFIFIITDTIWYTFKKKRTHKKGSGKVRT